MLTKDLLRYGVRNGAIKPSFIQTNNESLLNLANNLLSLYTPENNPLKKNLTEEASIIINSFGDIKLAKGINKIILDQCKFSSPDDYDYLEHRANIFNKTADILQKESFENYHAYQSAIYAKLESENDFIENGIYADLPEYEKLVKRKKIFPKELLERYNTSLVQSLLIYSSQLTLTINDSDSGKIRRVFKYLKFFRLVAEITTPNMKKRDVENKKYKKNPKKLIITINGPSSIFDNSRKYGLQLASFFPAICSLEKWKIETKVKLTSTEFDLKISQKSELICHYKNFTDYIPPEIKDFHKIFKSTESNWEIVGNTPFLDLGNQELIFPDLTFQHKQQKKIIHLELFHRWYYNIEKRLDLCEVCNNIPLIIGIDRCLAKKQDNKAILEYSSFFKNFGFVFNDFPITSKIIKALETKLKEII